MKHYFINFRFFFFIAFVHTINFALTAHPHATRKYSGKHYNDNVDVFTTDEISESKPMILAEVDMFQCPNGCVCQYAHFMDLPISRWISYMQKRQPGKEEKEFNNPESEENENDNEAVHDGDENFLMNPFIKQATCILQEDINADELINSLPLDLQALILLYTGIGHNKTVNISTLKLLNQLTTLEVRGTQDRTLRLIFDEPLSFIQHANFESITLLGSDSFKRPQNPIHPSDSFDYKPKSELYTSYEMDENSNATSTNSNGLKKLGFETPVEEVEILPYNVYMQELKKSRMPSFYGWEHLNVLRVHSCKLDELYWEMFDGLEALHHLSLERNEIVTVPAFALYGALHIRTLSLAHNLIQDLHYRSLAGLLELEMLDLSDNCLNKISERSFPPFPKLERIDFRYNPLRYIFPATFGIMNETKTMMFNSGKIALELWPNEPFESLSRLQELSIENVSIANLEHNIFKGLRSLQKLKLRGNVSKIDFDAFAGMSELQVLDLSYCGIQEISMDALIGFKSLRVLDLSFNNISYIPPGLFDDQIALQEIYLQGNNLRTLPDTFFLQPKLRLARLHDNPWQCSCEMVNWRAKITNQERGEIIERCISDFQTGKKIACRNIENYIFNNRLAPRCENYNGRSVFYVLRKQLQCPTRQIIRHSGKNRNHNGSKTNNKHKKNNQTNGNRLNSPSQYEHTKQRKVKKLNTLEYVLQREHLRRASQNKVHSSKQQQQEQQEISNEI